MSYLVKILFACVVLTNLETYEDLNSHLLTLTQLAEETTALTVCPFGHQHMS